MLPYNILGTQTGRFSTSDPNRELSWLFDKYSNGKSCMDMRDLRPKEKPISWALSDSVKKSHDKLRTLLNIDFRKLEQRAWALSHNYSFDFAFVQKLVPYVLDPVLLQPRDVYVMGKPIELNPLETFRVEITWPPLRTNLKAKIQDLLEPKCNCETRILMRAGCQCGGQ